MQKSEDAAILMQQDFNNIELLFPFSIDWDQWKLCKSNEPFSEDTIDFLNALSLSLIKDTQSRAYPDVVTFAFFCRKANLQNLKRQYSSDENKLRVSRGVLFHIAPSNVPLNFGYSLVAGLLSGNYNIVRISSKSFPQVDLVIKHIHQLASMEKWKNLTDRIALIRYDRDSEATHYFSSFCNVRIIWGGDNTIAQIRKSPLPARSFDVTFADRYSFAVINANELIKEKNIKKIAEGFYNDTYLFDQNACSAPHLVIWLGDEQNIVEAKRIFWGAIYTEVEKRYELQSVIAIDKLSAFYKQAVSMPVHLEKEWNDNRLIRVELEELPENIDDFRCAGGYFSEYTVTSLDDIVPIINSKYQTMAYYGLEYLSLKNLVRNNHIVGIDRIVPIGSTTDFTLIWDGYNLIDAFTRECYIQ